MFMAKYIYFLSDGFTDGKLISNIKTIWNGVKKQCMKYFHF